MAYKYDVLQGLDIPSKVSNKINLTVQLTTMSSHSQAETEIDQKRSSKEISLSCLAC